MAIFVEVFTDEKLEVQLGLQFGEQTELDVLVMRAIGSNLQLSVRYDRMMSTYCCLVTNLDIPFHVRYVYVTHDTSAIQAVSRMVLWLVEEKVDKIKWSAK